VLDAAMKARYSTQIAVVYRNGDAEAMVMRRLVGLFAAAVVNDEQSKLIGAKNDRLPNVYPGFALPYMLSYTRKTEKYALVMICHSLI
jgi:hypothetical protein